MTYGTVEVTRTTAGTFTLTRCEHGQRERYRAGIADHDEAIRRARAVGDALHLRVVDRCRTEAGAAS